ncbi:hypothetical protein F5Y03DRAFT_397324 [Xylaria venustula]|nr:hypothetical protein F5Y03DRAFT_397324 [Xylaria venustula]
MCRRAAVIYELCSCLRCRFADVLDHEERWYYPHHGTSIVRHEPHPAYLDLAADDPPEPVYTAIIVEPEDRCRSAVFANNEWDSYLSCDNPPVDLSIQYWYDEDDEICQECLRVCYAPRDAPNHSPRGIDQLSVSSASVPSDDRSNVGSRRNTPDFTDLGPLPDCSDLESLVSGRGSQQNIASLGSLSLGSQSSLESLASGGNNAVIDREEEERLLAIRQRIYRNVLSLMGYPEGTRLPQRVAARPPL